jgi:hypothetical protein
MVLDFNALINTLTDLFKTNKKDKRGIHKRITATENILFAVKKELKTE